MSENMESCEMNPDDPDFQPAKTSNIVTCANRGCAANNGGYCFMENTECYGYFKPEVEG